MLMSSESGDSRSPSLTGDTDSLPPVKFTLQEAHDSITVDAIPPTHASTLASKYTGNPDGPIPEYREFSQQNKTTTFDAFRTGWVLYSPVSFTVEESGDDEYTVRVDTDGAPDDLVELQTVNGEALLRVNTLWNIDFPEGYAGHATRVLAFAPSPLRTVPQAVGMDSESASGTVVMRVTGPGRHARGQPLCQVFAVEEETPDATAHGASSEEWDEIVREERRRRLYPDVYSDERRLPPTGTVKPKDTSPESNTPNND